MAAVAPINPILQHALPRAATPMSIVTSSGRPTDSINVHLWVHPAESTAFKHEAIFNYNLFPNKLAQPGDLVEVSAIDDPTPNYRANGTGAGNKSGGESEFAGAGHGRTKRFLFVIRYLSKEERAKQPQLQLSITVHVAALFKLQSRSTVRVTLVDKTFYEASHVELAFKDQYIARSDMWRLAAQELADNCVYDNRKINFIGSIKAKVTGVWVRGQKVDAAYFSPRTRPIFRSQSARYVLFVQMSREMWHFETEGNGEILFNKMINGFLPELFKRWRRNDSHHLVSIVLFTRIFYSEGALVGIMDEGEELRSIVREGGTYTYRDFFRVVVSNRESDDWTIILHQLKKEFSVFLKDVLLRPNSLPKKTPAPEDEDFSPLMSPSTPTIFTPSQKTPSQPPGPDHIIAGEPSSSIHGNVLEAINLATGQFSRDHVDRDLVRTGISIIIVTPGTGHFVVDQNMLHTTTENLVANGIGIDLVCLARPPLHSVPLFRYQTPKAPERPPDHTRSRAGTFSGSPPTGLPNGSPKNDRRRSGASLLTNFNTSLNIVPPVNIPAGTIPAIATEPEMEWNYAIPHWIDVSFWSTNSERKSKHRRQQAAIESRASNITGVTKREVKARKGAFMARCKMYELQMMGIMEDEVVGISIPFLHDSPLYAPLPAPPSNKKLAALASEQGSDHKDRTLSSSLVENAKDRYRAEEKAAVKFMDAYDDIAFKSLAESSAVHEKARTQRQHEDQKKIDKMVKEDPKILGTSFRSDHSERGNANPGGYFERKMKERRPSLESPNEMNDISPSSVPKESLPSARQSLTTNVPVPRLARQISNGLRGVFGAPKASPIAGLSTGGTILTRGFNPSAAAITAEGSLINASSKDSSTGASRPRRPSISSTSLSSPLIRGMPSPGRPSSVMASPWVSRPIAIKSSASVASNEDILSRNAELLHDKFTRKQSLAIREGHPNGNKDWSRPDALKNASQARLAAPRLDLAQSSGQISAPTTLSPSSALLPWFTILNPSNPKASPHNPKNQFRRWQHVFPRPLRVQSIKWKSLCSPAALPLTTEYFPTPEQLRTEYEEAPYVIAQNDDDNVEDISRNRKELVREMVSQRLARGFQIVVGTSVQEANTTKNSEPDIFAMDYMTMSGSSIFMSMGPHIHQLICDEEFNVEVKRFTRKQTSTFDGAPSAPPIQYTAYVRTMLSKEYFPQVSTFNIPVLNYNWNYLDRYLGGYEEDFSESMKFWRARFVLIPIEPSKVENSIGGPSEELNDEENRLEGIRKITQLFQRYRYVPPEERRYQRSQRSRKGLKDPNPLEIKFKTENPSQIVAKELDPLNLLDNEQTGRPSLFAEMFERRTMKLQHLAQELQGPRGVRLQDRRWHLRLHYNCFIGSEIVTWMLNNFKDIASREEAVDYGNELMTESLFQHVERRHVFRDGNFFYQLQSDYINPAARPVSKAGWFGSRKPTDNETHAPERPVSRSRANSVATDELHITSQPPAFTPRKQRLKIELSKVMRYNLDPSKKSYRPEIVNLHYDRLHNPDNCYHIRVDWLNVTSKLIEDAVSMWAKTIHRYGLKLVEAPIDEVSVVAEANPFRTPAIISLAIPPPVTSSEEFVADLPSTGPRDVFLYHVAILKKFGFVLDIEAAKNFPPDINVVYSWGKPHYKYTQFIHRSGVIFAQITDEGHFLLLANRLYSQRVGNTDKNYHTLTERMPSQTSQINHRQGQGTSSIGAQHSYTVSTITNSQFGQGTTLAPTNGPYVTAEMIKEELATFCRDSEKLQIFYDEVTARTAIPMTPLVTGLTVPSAVMRAAVGGNLESVPSSPAMLALGGSTFSPAATTTASAMGRVSSVSGKSGRSSLKSSDTSGTE